jgi:hypothetical protein
MANNTANSDNGLAPLDSTEATPEAPGASTLPRFFVPLQFDPREFMQFVENEGLTEQEAQQLLRAIWDIMVAFVDLAWGVHPVQQAVDRFHGGGGSSSAGAPVMLSCSDIFSNTANNETAEGDPRATATKEDS